MRKRSNRVPRKVREKLKKIKMIVLDFDGVLTDNHVFQNSKGEEFVRRSRADSLAIDILDSQGLYRKSDYKNRKHPLDLIILSKETNQVVNSVAEKIKIKCLDASDNKVSDLKKELEKRKMAPSEVCFVGNDLNDLEVMEFCGLAICPFDAVPRVLSVADYISQSKGGNGVLRELVDLIVS